MISEQYLGSSRRIEARIRQMGQDVVQILFNMQAVLASSQFL